MRSCLAEMSILSSAAVAAGDERNFLAELPAAAITRIIRFWLRAHFVLPTRLLFLMLR